MNRRAETWLFEFDSRTERIFERKKARKRSMDLSFRSEEGEGCESESQKFFIVFESPECIDNKCRIREKKVKVKEICKKFKSYINLTRT